MEGTSGPSCPRTPPARPLAARVTTRTVATSAVGVRCVAGSRALEGGSMRFVPVIVRRAVATAVLLAALAFASPAGAVVGGTDDLGNRYESVGVLQLDADGEWFDFCSGTLVAENVV